MKLRADLPKKKPQVVEDCALSIQTIKGSEAIRCTGNEYAVEFKLEGKSGYTRMVVTAEQAQELGRMFFAAADPFACDSCRGAGSTLHAQTAISSGRCFVCGIQYVSTLSYGANLLPSRNQFPA